MRPCPTLILIPVPVPLVSINPFSSSEESDLEIKCFAGGAALSAVRPCMSAGRDTPLLRVHSARMSEREKFSENQKQKR